MYNKLCYQKYVKGSKKQKNEVPDENVNGEEQLVEEAVEPEPELSYEEELQYLLYFKTCVVGNPREKDILKMKMVQTIALREKLFAEKKTEFSKAFPFYFTASDLVRDSFTYIYLFTFCFIIFEYDNFSFVHFFNRSLLTLKFDSNQLIQTL